MDLVLYCILLFLSCSFYIPLSSGDLYSVLGVSRTATQSEIKEAYHQRALKLHPDKNPDSDAEEKFVELNKAYEILSKPKKRAEYDAFGHTHDNPEHPGPRGPRYSSHFTYSNLEDLFEFFPGFSRQAMFSSNVVDLDFRSYRLIHLPKSRSSPLLILGYSAFCIPCQRLRPLWSQLADELSPLGVVVAAVNLEHDAAIRDELRVFHVPSIVMVIDGQISYYSQNGFAHSRIVDAFRQALLRSNPSRSNAIPSFLSTTLDTPLIQVVHSSDSFLSEFHPGWRRDSRPRVLLFKPLSVPSLRLLLAAFRAADHVATGFVNTESSSTAELVRRYRLPFDEESLLIFHEDPDRPVFSLSAPRLPTQDLDHAIQSFSQLAVPRLFSAARLLDLCPTDGKGPATAYAAAAESRLHSDWFTNGHHTHRHFCLVLIGHSKLANLEHVGGPMDRWLSAFRRSLPEIRKHLEQILAGHYVNLRLQPTHVYADLQARWLRHLSEGLGPGQSLTDPQNIGRLFLLWRISSSQTAVHLLSDPNSELHPSTILPLSTPSSTVWSVSEVSSRLSSALTPVLADILSGLRFQRSAVDLADSGWHLTSDYFVEEHVSDELAAPLWLKMRRRLFVLARDGFEWIIDFMDHPLSVVFSTGLIAVALLLFSFVKMLFNAASDELKAEKESGTDRKYRTQTTAESKQPPGPRSFRRIVPATVVSLNSLTYDSLIRHAPKGSQLLILCVRGGRTSQDNRLCANFASKTAHVAGPLVQCAQLSLERYVGWLARLLEIARSGMPVRVRHSGSRIGDRDRPGTVFVNPANCVGTVLAVNGYRRYFSLYHPMLPGAESSSDGSDSEVSVPGSDVEMNTVSRISRTISSSPSAPVVRRRRVFGHIFGLDSDEDDDSGDDATRHVRRSSARASSPRDLLLESELLDGLPNWLDRLFEGSLRRYQVTDWPESLRADSLDQSD